MNIKKELVAHYMAKSKHSSYQILPKNLESLMSSESVVTNTRYEPERLKYLINNIEFKGKSVLDIGGNTGYFSFEILDYGASKVTYIEGNTDHAEFVELGSKYLSHQDKLHIKQEYFDFSDNHSDKYDIVLLFNVLHHVGDDYGNELQNIDEAKKLIKTQLNSLAKNTRKLVFQLGFNWQGDTSKPLFDFGSKQEQIDFVNEMVEGTWDITHIGIAEKVENSIVYRLPTSNNLKRDDELGEFLNRPIFILEAI